MSLINEFFCPVTSNFFDTNPETYEMKSLLRLPVLSDSWDIPQNQLNIGSDGSTIRNLIPETVVSQTKIKVQAESTKLTDKKTSNSSKIEKIELKDDDKEKNKPQSSLGRKTNRKKIEEYESGKEIKNCHNCSARDNCDKAVFVDFQNFLIEFSNKILENLKIKEVEFLKINQKIKLKLNTLEYSELKDMRLKDFINQEISEKYTQFDKNNNINIFNQYANNEVFKKIFDIKYPELFKIYFKNIRNINLKNYISEINCGVYNHVYKENIELGKNIGLFNEFLEKKYKKLLAESKNEKMANDYKQKLKNCAIKKLNPKYIFSY